MGLGREGGGGRTDVAFHIQFLSDLHYGALQLCFVLLLLLFRILSSYS